MFQVIRAIAVFVFIVVFLNACGGESDGSSTPGDSSGPAGTNTGTNTSETFGALATLVTSLTTSTATQNSSIGFAVSQSVGTTYTLADAAELAQSSGLPLEVVSGIFHFYGELTITGANNVSFTDSNSCVTCHGADGTGTALAPIPINNEQDIQVTCTVDCTEINGLTDEIARTMPLSGEGSCTGTAPGTCAYDIASLLLDEVSSNVIAPEIIIVNPTLNRSTTEDGGMASIQMRLTTPPENDVNIDFTSNDLTEGTVNPARLTFTSDNFNTLQTVTVTGIPDFEVDGDINYTILTAPAQSADTDYAGMNPADITVTNIDNAVAPAVTVDPVSGLVTDENGVTANFSVVLSSVAPSSNVLIDVTSLNTAEGLVSVDGDAPAASTTLTFTPDNYNIQQFVTVTGQDDGDNVDGNIDYMVSVNMNVGTVDPMYAAIDPSDVILTNNDNDVPPVIGVVVNPTNGLVTTEAGGSDTFTIRLESNPAVTTTVTIPLASSNSNEGILQDADGNAINEVVFDSANGIMLQTITVVGVDDVVDDGDIAYTIVTGDPASADPNYDALTADMVDDVSVTNTDDDLSQLELGQQLYRTVFNTNDPNVNQSCETCHGATGLGGTTIFPVAPGSCLLGNCDDAVEFSAYTFTNMPRDSGLLIGIGAGESAMVVCDQACADAIAAYVFNGFSTTP